MRKKTSRYFPIALSSHVTAKKTKRVFMHAAATFIALFWFLLLTLWYDGKKIFLSRYLLTRMGISILDLSLHSFVTMPILDI